MKMLAIGIFTFLIFQLSGCATLGVEETRSVSNQSYQADLRVQSLERRIEKLEEDMDEVPEDTYYQLF